MTEDVEAIAGKLTKANRAGLAELTTDWLEGPSLPDVVLSELQRLRDACLVERQFGDNTPVSISSDSSQITMGVSACWHFRLTPLGLAVRTFLASKEPSDADHR